MGNENVFEKAELNMQNTLESEQRNTVELRSAEINKAPKRANPSSELDKQRDAITRIREEEKIKLDLLREKEQEKTRLIVEKERARLEAELAREINQLEAELQQTKLSSQSVKAKSSQQSDIESSIRLDAKEVVIEAAISTPKQQTPSTAVTAKAPAKKAKPAIKESNTSSTIQKAKKVVQSDALEKVKKVAIKKEIEPSKTPIKKTAKPKAALATKEQDVIEIPVIIPVEEQAVFAKDNTSKDITAIPVASKKTNAVAKSTATKAKVTEKPVNESLGKPKLAAINTSDVIEQKPTIAAMPIISQEISSKPSVDIISTPDQSTKAVVKPILDQKPVISKDSSSKPFFVENKVETTGIQMPVSSFNEDGTNKNEVKNSINNLQQLREKIAAQKKLEKELMEIEATKTQEKDRNLQNKYNSITQHMHNEEDNYVTLEELESEKKIINELVADKNELREHIENLNRIIDKVMALKVDGINVIDAEKYELSSGFLELGLDTKILDNTISEIGHELESLSRSHEKNIRQLISTENSYDQLHKKYLQKEIENEQLNSQIINLKDQIATEKILTKQVALQLENLKIESKVMEGRNVFNRHLDNSRNNTKELEDNGKNNILREFDRLSEEIRRILSTNEVSQTKDLLKSKESEINNLRNHVQNIPFTEESKPSFKQEIHCPYYACPSTMFVPRGFNYPQNNYMPNMANNYQSQDTFNNDQYAQEIRKLKEDIDELKSNVQSPAETKRLDDSLTLIQEVREELKNSREELKNSREELNKSREERQRAIQQEQRAIQQEQELQNQRLLKQKEEELQKENEMKKSLAKEKAEKDLKANMIKDLEDKISEKEELIEKFHHTYKHLSEEDIIDPDYKRKIRVIREQKRELSERSDQENDAYKESVQTLKDKIDFKQTDIDELNDKIFELDLNYKQNRDYSSATKDAYEKTKGKTFVELQLQEERLNELEKDLERLNSRYQLFLDSKDKDLEKINTNELETIQYYMSKLRHDYVSGTNYRRLKVLEDEKEYLVKQLEQLRSNSKADETELKKPINSDEKEIQDDKSIKADRNIKTLENVIKDITKEYNSLYDQLTNLKAELDKRVEYEKQLRTNEQVVYDYCTTKLYLEDCLKDYQKKSEQIEIQQTELDIIAQDMYKRTEQLKLKADIQDLTVHRDDVRAKIDFYKKHLIELESKEIVKTYSALLTQMEKIRSAQKDIRDQAETIKIEVQIKTRQLETMKNEKSRSI